MADPPTVPRPNGGHLDASGPREVVYCHQCENEWWKDEHGLICPRCEGEATEIVSAENDPRSIADSPNPLEELNQLQNHYPWPDDDIPDPDEGDVEEYVTESPGGRTRTTFYSRTFTNRPPTRSARNWRDRQSALDPDDPSNVIRDFQAMIGQFMGPGLRPGQAGRSGPDALFPRGEPEGFRQNPFGGGVVVGGTPGGPQVIGHRFTFTASSGRRPRDPEGQDIAVDDPFATYASPGSPSGPSFLVISIRARPDQLARMLGRSLRPYGPAPANATWRRWRGPARQHAAWSPGPIHKFIQFRKCSSRRCSLLPRSPRPNNLKPNGTASAIQCPWSCKSRSNSCTSEEET